MSDSDCESQSLLLSGSPSEKPEFLGESDERTTSDENFEDCVSDLYDAQQSEQKIEKDNSDKTTTDDQQPCSSNAPNVATSEGLDALRCFAGSVQSSSDNSNKNSSISSTLDLGCVVEYTTDESGNVGYVEVDFNDIIDQKHVDKLMTKLRLNHYSAMSCEGDFTLSKCKKLFERDYHCEMIDNWGGTLCRNYPERLIIPVARKSKDGSAERFDAIEFDSRLYIERVKTSVHSRLLTRFVAPVILFDRKFICRSGSLTVRKTAVFETARQIEQPKSTQVASCTIQQIARGLASSLVAITNRGCRAATQLFVPSSMEKIRDVDADILRDSVYVQRICDLMVEDRKKFINAIRVSSSEKINKSIYRDCEIEQMPYPGCSLFKKYHEADHHPEGLIFDWSRRDVNTDMLFTADPYENFPDINWANYKEWDLVDLTKNYLKMLLTYLVKDSGGLLVHCISGWDRTPLFISMLRVSLWADGLVHESLDYRDMAYLTLAYDWYLFGHDLPSRLRKRHEIMHFCFKFLDYIATDDFSVTRMFHELPLDQKRNRTFPEFKPEQRSILATLSKYVLVTYHDLITKNL